MTPNLLSYLLSKKSTTLKFLITLLILPSFPERTVCNAQKKYYQQQQQQHWHKPRYYSNFNFSSNGASTDLMKAGHYKRIHPATYHPTSLEMSPPKYYYRPLPQKPTAQKHTYNISKQGMVYIRQVPSLPPHLHGKPYQPPPPRVLPPKFKRKQTTYPVAVMDTNQKCMGRKNLIDDIGILSLLTAVMSSTFGMYTILVNSMTSNNIGIVSGFMSLVLWLPSTLITLFKLDGNFIYVISNLVNSISFVNSLYGFMGVFFGTADVLASAAGESVGIFSFILSVIATFPEVLDEVINYFLRVTGNPESLEYYVDNYGCSVPGIFLYFGKPLYHTINDILVHAISQKGH